MKINSPSSSLPPVAVITGAGSGIGEATAVRFSDEGWETVLIGRRLDRLEKTAKSLKTRTTLFPLDLSSPESGSQASKWVQMNPSISNRVTTLIHNAGIFDRGTTADSSDNQWHRIFETNLFAVIRLTQAFLPCLKSTKGSIVNVSSTLGLRPTSDTAAYSASKAALVNWTQSLALELGPFGVRANCVCPGIVDTPIHSFHETSNKNEVIAKMGSLQPLGRIGQPADISHMIYALASSGAAWTTGAVVAVDGGINLT